MPSKYWFLKRIKLFSDLPDQDIKMMEETTRMEAVKRREVIFLPGDPAQTVFLLKTGRVKLSRINEDGKEWTMAILEPGEVFGELEMLEGSKRDTVAEALDDCSICVMQRPDFEAMLKKDPNTSLRLTKLVGLRLKKIENRVENLVFRDVPSRLAQLLIQLSEEVGVKDARGILFRVKITHQDLASLIGSTRETVSATLGEFKKKGLIDIDQRRIILKDSKGLSDLVSSSKKQSQPS
ncbi:MAG TPA: Crp/Fnr family transcriptional regulator [Nitrospiria bacterium]|nr:Crp/Fnr family transcriptional regulator [Nitrospiria bacterium]